jgi:hypothetical protein
VGIEKLHAWLKGTSAEPQLQAAPL